MPLNAHVDIQEVARNIAATIWEDTYAHDNQLYRAMLANYGTEKAARLVFVNQVAPKFYEQARIVLVTMLGAPEDRIPESVKQKIYDAIILDNPHRGNRQVAPELVTLPKDWSEVN